MNLSGQLTKFKPGDVAISAITWQELQYGVEKSAHKEQNAAALANFIVSIDILPFDETAAAEAGRICALLEKKGISIGAYNNQIAGHALSLGLTLVTNNEREFNRVPKLKTVNWAK